MKNQKGSSRLDAALKMLLIAFISLLAFSSGVFFGKQMSDSDYQLKALETDFKDQTKTAEGGKGKDERPTDALVDEDVAALSDKLVNAEKGETKHEAKKEGKHEEKREVASEKSEGKAEHHADGESSKHEVEHAVAAAKKDQDAAKHEHDAAKHDEAKHEAAKHETSKHETEKHETEKTAHGGGEVMKAAERVAMNTPPSEHSKPKAETHSTKTLPTSIGAPTEGEFTVQVASYPEAAEAKARAADLAKKGFPAYPVEANVKGKTWYRVSVGSFRTAKEAGVYRAQLLKQSDLRSAIVQKIER